MVEVMEHAPDTLTPRERYVLVVLAENARDSTRVCFPGIEDNEAFIRRSRLVSRSQRYAVIKALVEKGALERAKRGQKWVQAGYRIPALAPPQGPENEDPEADVETDLRVPETGTQGPENGDAENRDPEAQGPGIQDSGSRFSGLRVPETGTPSPQYPSLSPQGGVGGEDPTPTPAPPSEPTRTERLVQSALIPVTAVRMTESQQIVYDSLRWQAGYTDVTEDEAREVLQLVRKRLGSRTRVAYLKKMGGPDGGGFSEYLTEIRQARAVDTEQKIKDLEASEPPCEHGTPAGRALHPLHPDMVLCPMCRAGLPEVNGGPTTDPVVAEAISAYLTAYAGKPETAWLIQVTQQLVALHTRGANRDQLVDLARRAGAGRVGIIHAATQGATK